MPGSKTQFVCFRKFRHVRCTGHKRLRIFALLLTEVPNPELTFVSVSLSSMNSNLRHPTLFLSELFPCSCLTALPVSFWNYDLTWSLIYPSTERRILCDGVALWTQITIFLQGKEQTFLTIFAWDIIGCVSHGLKSNVFLDSESISSTPSAPSTLMVGTEKIPKKFIPSPLFTRQIQWYVTHKIFKSYTKGTIISLVKFSTKLSSLRVMWYWRTRLWTLRFEV
jgi:hypothetical protein